MFAVHSAESYLESLLNSQLSSAGIFPSLENLTYLVCVSGFVYVSFPAWSSSRIKQAASDRLIYPSFCPAESICKV